MRQILKKIFFSLVTLIGILLLTYTLLHIVPGGPFDQERQLPPEIKANLFEKYHLQPRGDLSFTHWIWQETAQYIHILKSGSLGPSLINKNQDVGVILLKAVQPSLIIGTLALGFALVVGITLGLFLSYTARSFWAPIILQGLSLLITLPHFVWAAILVALFAFNFQWLPPALWESPRFWILPSLVLSLAPLAYLAQITFEAVQKEKNLDYVRTTQAIGVSMPRIYLKHILKNAVFSLLAVIGPIAANLLTGSFIVENIFAIPGLGRQFVNGILNRDYFLVMGTILIYSTCLIAINLTTETLASVLDPRVKQHE